MESITQMWLDKLRDEWTRPYREALAPFAALAEVVDDLRHEDDSTCPHRLKASDLRRARAVLSGSLPSSDLTKEA